MRLISLLAFGLLIADLVGVPTPVRAGSPAGTAALDLPGIIAPLLKTVVNISVVKQQSGGQETAPPDRAVGSGFVISPDGYIVTNKHVVDGAYAVSVAFNDGSTYSADIVATNGRPDLALLKVNTGKPLPSAKFGDSDALRVGEPVVAIGNPFGFTSSVSVGVISALNRDVNTTMIDDFIQTDATINHGNSGGPLFNLKGEVIGVNWAIYAPNSQLGSSGLGFAIPASDVVWAVDQMRRYGRLHPGFIGLRIQQVTADIQSVLGLPSRSGGIITGVMPKAPAAVAGLREGDVVLALDGREPRDVRALLRRLSASTPGSKITLQVWRDGAAKNVDLQVANWPNSLYDPAGPQTAHDHSARRATPDLGLTLAAADPAVVSSSVFSVGRSGVAVSGVAANSPAADLGLTTGDVILRVAEDVVATPADVSAKLDSARAAGRAKVLLLVLSKSGPKWIVMPLKDP